MIDPIIRLFIIDFTDAKIDTKTLRALTSNIKPVIDSILKQIPIYRIKKDRRF